MRLHWPLRRFEAQPGSGVGADLKTSGAVLCCRFSGSEEEGTRLNKLANAAIEGLREEGSEWEAWVAGQYVWMVLGGDVQCLHDAAWVERSEMQTPMEEFPAPLSGMAKTRYERADALCGELEGLLGAGQTQVWMAGIGMALARYTGQFGDAMALGVIEWPWLSRAGCNSIDDYETPFINYRTMLGLSVRHMAKHSALQLDGMREAGRQIAIGDRVFGTMVFMATYEGSGGGTISTPGDPPADCTKHPYCIVLRRGHTRHHYRIPYMRAKGLLGRADAGKEGPHLYDPPPAATLDEIDQCMMAAMDEPLSFPPTPDELLGVAVADAAPEYE